MESLARGRGLLHLSMESCCHPMVICDPDDPVDILPTLVKRSQSPVFGVTFRAQFHFEGDDTRVVTCWYLPIPVRAMVAIPGDPVWKGLDLDSSQLLFCEELDSGHTSVDKVSEMNDSRN